ncbi:MAG: HEAT repeat domain-containing protein [Deferribacterales bacterium]
MSVKISQNDGIMIVKLPDSLELQDFKIARDSINNARDIKEIRLDLKDVTYLQSKYIAELIAIKKVSISKNLKLVLTNVQEGVFQMLEISNLLDHFTLGSDYSSYSPHELMYLIMDPEQYDAVVDYIAGNFNDEFKHLVEDFLVSEDPILIEAALFIIGKAHCFEMVDKVKECLNSPYPNVLRAAMLVVGWFGEEDCKERIYNFLKDEHIDVAEAAAATIALLADENDSLIIKDYLESNDERIRRIAIQALSLINDDNAYRFLIDHLKKEKDELLLVQLAKAISYFNKPEVADILLKLLSQGTIKIREAAASSLVRIKATDKINNILALVSDKDVWVAYFAVKAIGELCRTKECGELLIKQFGKVDTQVKIAIIEALGKMKADAAEFLYQLIDHENEDVRKEVLNSLANIDKDMAVEAAINDLKDESWVVRFKAVEILEQFKPENYINILKDYVKNETNRYVKEKILSIVGGL